MTKLIGSEFYSYISHRKPFLLLEEIEIIESHKSIKGIKYTAEQDWYFEGHFPGNPLFPGVLMLEMMAQAGCVLVAYSLQLDARNYNTYFGSANNVKFRKTIHPGDIITCHVDIIRNKDKYWKFKGQVRVEEQIAAEGEFMAILEEKQ